MAHLGRVDCHVHYLPSEFQGLEERAARVAPLVRVTLQRPAWRDLGLLTSTMDATGVALGLIIASHTSAPELRGRPSHIAYEAYNRSMSADLQLAAGRFLATAVVDPFGGKEDLAQLRRSLELPNIAGVGLVTNYGNVTLDDPRFEPIFAVAAEYDAPVTVHPGSAWPSWSDALRLKESSFLQNNLGYLLADSMCIFLMAHAGVFDRFPTVRFMFCQLGGIATACCGRWAAAIQHARIALPEGSAMPSWTSHSLNDVLGHVWLDTHSSDRHAIALAIAEAGETQIVLGSDYPITLPDLGMHYTAAELSALNLSKQTLAKLEQDNALALLGHAAPGSQALGDLAAAKRS